MPHAIEKKMGSIEPISVTQLVILLRKKKLKLRDLNQIILNNFEIIIDLLTEDVLSNSKKLDWDFLTNYILVGVHNSTFNQIIRDKLPSIKKIGNDKRINARTLIAKYLAKKLFNKSEGFAIYANYRKLKSCNLLPENEVTKDILESNPYLVELLEGSNIFRFKDLWDLRLNKKTNLIESLRCVEHNTVFNRLFIEKLRLSGGGKPTLVINCINKLMTEESILLGKKLSLYFADTLEGTPFEGNYYILNNDEIEKCSIWNTKRIYSKVDLKLIVKFICYALQEYKIEELIPINIFVVISNLEPVSNIDCKSILKAIGFSQEFCENFQINIIKK